MINLDTFELDSGSHISPEAGMCAMEMVAYLAKEPHSDSPACTCPVLSSYVRKLNDQFGNEDRQLLKPYLQRLIGTRDDKAVKRAHILSHAALTVFAPFTLEKAGLLEQSEIMRNLVFGEWEKNKNAADAAADAARAAAYAAARAAAYAAAHAAYAAAFAANAAYYAAANAADAAARAAAYAAAYADKTMVQAALRALEHAINA